MRVKWVFIILGMLFCVAFGVLCSKAYAHKDRTGFEFPSGCCNGQDCDLLPLNRVETRPDGYHVTVMPGEHPFVKDSPYQTIIPYSAKQLRDSPDEYYRLCISPTHELRCFFRGRVSG